MVFLIDSLVNIRIVISLFFHRFFNRFSIIFVDLSIVSCLFSSCPNLGLIRGAFFQMPPSWTTVVDAAKVEICLRAGRRHDLCPSGAGLVDISPINSGFSAGDTEIPRFRSRGSRFARHKPLWKLSPIDDVFFVEISRSLNSFRISSHQETNVI